MPYLYRKYKIKNGANNAECIVTWSSISKHKHIPMAKSKPHVRNLRTIKYRNRWESHSPQKASRCQEEMATWTALRGCHILCIAATIDRFAGWYRSVAISSLG